MVIYIAYRLIHDKLKRKKPGHPWTIGTGVLCPALDGAALLWAIWPALRRGLKELPGRAWRSSAAGEPLDFLHSGIEAAAGEGGEFLTDANVFRGNGQEPGFGG